MAATHMGASNTKEYFEKWIKYLKLKKKRMAEIQDGSYMYGGIQTYRGPSKHVGIQTYRGCIKTYGHIQTYRECPNIKGGIQAYGWCPNIWGHPNIAAG